jgi:hypothetical protein
VSRSIEIQRNACKLADKAAGDANILTEAGRSISFSMASNSGGFAHEPPKHAGNPSPVGCWDKNVFVGWIAGAKPHLVRFYEDVFQSAFILVAGMYRSDFALPDIFFGPQQHEVAGENAIANHGVSLYTK